MEILAPVLSSALQADYEQMVGMLHKMCLDVWLLGPQEDRRAAADHLNALMHATEGASLLSFQQATVALPDALGGHADRLSLEVARNRSLLEHAEDWWKQLQEEFPAVALCVSSINPAYQGLTHDFTLAAAVALCWVKTPGSQEAAGIGTGVRMLSSATYDNPCILVFKPFRVPYSAPDVPHALLAMALQEAPHAAARLSAWHRWNLLSDALPTPQSEPSVVVSRF